MNDSHDFSPPGAATNLRIDTPLRVRCTLNGQPVGVQGADLWLSVAEFLRQRRGLTGTKIVCAEGDCGACTVLVGRPGPSGIRYQAVNACLLPVVQLDGTHLVSIEGLAGPGGLTAVQSAMVACHGSQCGYCTPGMVMTLTALLQETNPCGAPVTPAQLVGNLCRCTGYLQILESAWEAAGATRQVLADRFPDQHLRDALLTEETPSREGVIPVGGQLIRFASPTSLAQALEFARRYPRTVVLAGGTDLFPALKHQRVLPESVLLLRQITELSHVEVEAAAIRVGANVTWEQFEPFAGEYVPEFLPIVRRFGSPQIRSVATLAGNVVWGSSIADSLPFLLIQGAEVELQSPAGPRRLTVSELIEQGGRRALREGELLTHVRIPRSPEDGQTRLYRVSHRHDLDVAVVTAAIRLVVESGRIQGASIALGGVGPRVIRAVRTEAFLCGRPWQLETLQQAGEVALSEISPRSDVRGSREYRQTLVRNLLLKYGHDREITGPGSPASESPAAPVPSAGECPKGRNAP